MPFELELAGAVRVATREALASTSGVESSTVHEGSLVLRIVDQSALVGTIVKANSLGLVISAVVADPDL